MKLFTIDDVINVNGQFPRIYTDKSELVYDAPQWMRRGLQETASGYGKRLNSGLKINFNSRLYRIYVTIFSNAGSSWFVSRGKKIYVD